MDVGEVGLESMTVWVESKAGFSRETVYSVEYECEKPPNGPAIVSVWINFIARGDLFLKYLLDNEAIQLHFGVDEVESDRLGKPVESTVVAIGKIVSHGEHERNKDLRRVVFSMGKA